MPYISQWLKHAEESKRKLDNTDLQWKTVNGVLTAHLDPNLSLVNKLSQINILQQCEHVISYSLVAERIKKGELRLHAWYFDIMNADVYSFSDRKERFVVID